MKKITTSLYLMLLILTLIACGRENSETPDKKGNVEKETKMTDSITENQDNIQEHVGEKSSVKGVRIKMTIGDQELIAVMEDNPTTRSFLRKLPATISFKDFAGGEKIGEAPSKLSTENAPEGYDPKLGDITYYSPWNNIAVMYNERPYASGLIPMGHFESGVEILKGLDGDIKAEITKCE